MALDLQNTIQRIASMGDVLVEKYRLMRDAKIQAENRVAELQAQVEALAKQCDDLKRENEALRVMRTLSNSDEQIKQNKALIAELVQEIDKCISQLSE